MKGYCIYDDEGSYWGDMVMKGKSGRRKMRMGMITMIDDLRKEGYRYLKRTVEDW